MAFCSKCGSAVSEGAVFCSVCGSPASATAGQVTPPIPPPPAAGTTGVGISSNVAAALSYLVGFITGIIFLVVDPYKNDKFVRFHAFQSIGFSVVIVILEIVWSMIVSVGLLSLGFLFAIFSLVGFVLWLAIIVFWLFLMYKAYNNETYMIPVIGEWASKQAAK
jgi:uncharacterized membrane protein